MERLSSDNWVWNYTVIYINRDARGWEGGWLIIYYFLAVVPIIEFSDMFCCEQLSPNERKQICDLKPYLEVRLYLGDEGLIFPGPVDCVCSFSGSHQLRVWGWVSSCIWISKRHSLEEAPWFREGKNKHWVRSWFNAKDMFGRECGLFFIWFTSSQCGRGRTKLLCQHEDKSYTLLFLCMSVYLRVQACVCVEGRTTSLCLSLVLAQWQANTMWSDL